MEPAGERREHLVLGTAYKQVHTPQWSPPLNGGSTGPAFLDTHGFFLEPQWSPPLNGGSTAPRFRAVLTCADRWSRERSGPGGAVGPSDGLVKIQEMSTDLRASAPGGCVTTSALALKMMTARDEGSFSW